MPGNVIRQRLIPEGGGVIGRIKTERQIADPGVARGGSVVSTSVLTNRNVAEAVAVPHRAYTDSHVLSPCCVVQERTFTHGCIAVALGVAVKRKVADGRVERTAGIAVKGAVAVSGIERAGGVAKERKPTVGGVIRAGRGGIQRIDPFGGAVAVAAVFRRRGRWARSWSGRKRFSRRGLRDFSLNCWRKRNAAECKHDEEE